MKNVNIFAALLDIQMAQVVEISSRTSGINTMGADDLFGGWGIGIGGGGGGGRLHVCG